ncbi:MAG: NADH-quinone oxidoreductase subunit K [Deltaproteobacteria bacterium]|nr:NADH-quinone oxidoreductase subunit K [Deltaproteobacteria bacterium]
MIPTSHVLLLALVLLSIGLVGIFMRRSGMVVLASTTVCFGGVVVAICTLVQGGEAEGSGLQAAGMVVLALAAGVTLVGASALYSFHRFRRSVSVDEHDRLRR